ncbi:DUF3237 family protein, partial [Rhizobium ruizarguesonis]
FIALHPTLELGQKPAGGRRIFPASGGHFQGERLKGELSPLIGSYLLLARTDGTFQQDKLIVKGSWSCDRHWSLCAC